MGKTAMPIIWFLTKISSVVSERLNTPALIIMVHLEFHSNLRKTLLKNIENTKNYAIIKLQIWVGSKIPTFNFIKKQWGITNE